MPPSARSVHKRKKTCRTLPIILNSSCLFPQAKALAEREAAARKLSEEREREERLLEEMRRKADAEARYEGSVVSNTMGLAGF